MKKIIFSIFLAIMSIGAEAQATWNIRLGAGSSTTSWCPGGSFTIVGQSNIPFKRGGKWTFSPSLNYTFGFAGFEVGQQLTAPLELGRKVLTGRRNIFYPKFGFVGGVYFDEDNCLPILGPSLSLDTEVKHFVFGVGMHYSGIPRSDYYREYNGFEYDYERFDVFSFQLTFGYKF